MTEQTIRAMTADDRSGVIAMLLHSEPWKRLGYGQADWDRYFSPTPAGRETYVVDVGGIVVGVAVLRSNFLAGDYLELFAVAGGARGRGLGRQLLKHLESIVFARSKNLFACVSDFNENARRFYKKQGYQEIGLLPGLLVSGSAEILVRKTTGPARGKKNG